MKLTIGKVAKLFGVSPETLRYYEKEGFLSPLQDKENQYRQYSFEDLFLLTDLLFYRDIGMPIRDIHQIFDGLSVDEITELIREKQLDVQEKIHRLENSLTKLRDWEEYHKEALEYYGKFDFRPMPATLCAADAYEDYETSLETLQSGISGAKNLAFFVTLSFFCDFRQSETPPLKRYVALDRGISKNLEFNFAPVGPKGRSIIEEKDDCCLFTVVKYQHDAKTMLAPLFQYASENGISLSGEVYGRQSINYYSQQDYGEYYRIYAPTAK